MENFFRIIEIIIILNCFIVFYRAIKGPYLPDRIIAVNIVSTTAVVLMVLFSCSENFIMAVDVAFVYCLLLLVTNVAIARYVETGVLDV